MAELIVAIDNDKLRTAPVRVVSYVSCSRMLIALFCNGSYVRLAASGRLGDTGLLEASRDCAYTEARQAPRTM